MKGEIHPAGITNETLRVLNLYSNKTTGAADLAS